ncbi:PilZ domain-containing protein [Acidobacteria bacterium AH-259-D05]|nr:PilZ domain-containing protein [Acidobacteria bacterium AH-259-D05]
MSKERRQFKRLNVSVPCTVNWQGQKIKGLINDISPKGALISKLQAVPPVSALVAVKFRVREDTIEMLCTVDSVVVRSVSEIVKGKRVGSVAVLFEDKSEEIRSKLNAILYTLATERRSP